MLGKIACGLFCLNGIKALILHHTESESSKAFDENRFTRLEHCTVIAREI